MRGLGVVTMAPLCLLACGGRSGLYAPSSGRDGGAFDATLLAPDSTFDASPSRDAVPDATYVPDVSIAPEDVVVIPTGCTSALERGSPAPISGYCSTQANVASTRVPSHPRGTWATQLDANYSPSEMVVDPEGRTYLASCSAPEGGGWVECDSLVALEPNGAIGWSHTFDGGVGGLFLAPDGTLHVESGVPRTLFTFDADGRMTTLATLPESVTYSYVGSDGNLYGYAVDYGGTAVDRVVKMTSDGKILWSTPLTCNECIDATALAPDDGMVVALIVPVGDGGLAGSVLQFDSAGNLRWTRDLPGFSAEMIAVATDRSIRIVLWVPEGRTSATTVLASLSPTGDVLWQTDVHQDPEQTGLDPLVVMNDGTTVFRSFTDLNAVDVNGNVLWTTTLACPNCAYAAGADPDGGLVVLVDDIEGVDVATGKVLWSGIVPPQDGSTFYYGSTMVLGPPGVLFGSSFGGVVFAASDP